MDIAAILELVKPIMDYGFITVFAIVCLVFMVKYGWRYISEGSLFKKEPQSDFSKHGIFKHLELLIQVKIPAIKINEKIRTVIVQDMLKMVVEAFSDRFKKFVLENQTKKVGFEFDDNESFYEAMFNCVLSANKEYEDKWKKYGIPEICIEKFQEWHNPKTDLLYSEIRTICFSDFYQSYNDKASSIFDITQSSISSVLLDVEYTLNTLNGDLTGKTYKGVIIGELDYSDEESTKYIVKKPNNQSWKQILKTPKPGSLKIEPDKKN